MRFGLISANLMGNVDGAAAQETAQTAEEVGFDSLWAIEHVAVPKSYSSTYPYDEGGRLFKGASQLDHSDPLIWLTYGAEGAVDCGWPAKRIVRAADARECACQTRRCA